MTCLRDGHTDANRRYGVLQWAARTHMHMHVPGCHERQPRRIAEIHKSLQPLPVVRTSEQLDGNPRSIGATVRDTPCVAEIRGFIRNDECNAMLGARLQIVPFNAIAALFAAASRG